MKQRIYKPSIISLGSPIGNTYLLKNYIDIVSVELNSQCGHNAKTLLHNWSKSDKIMLFLMMKQKEVIGGALVRRVTIETREKQDIKCANIGPFVITKKYQGQGLGNYLLRHIVNNLANEYNVNTIYLRGIKDFYKKNGFKPMHSRTKLIMNCNLSANYLTSNRVQIRQMANADLSHINNIYKIANKENQLHVKRDINDWNWLMKNKHTSYFYNPQIIIINNRRIGYFTGDPQDKNLLRECIIESENINDVRDAYNQLAYRGEDKKIPITIFHPINLEKLSIISSISNFSFEYEMNRDGGQLCYQKQNIDRLKIYDDSEEVSQLDKFFIKKKVYKSKDLKISYKNSRGIHSISKSNTEQTTRKHSFIYQGSNI